MEKVYLFNKKPMLLIFGYMLFMDALAIGAYLVFPDEKTAKAYLIVGPIAVIAQVSFFLLVRKRKAVSITKNFLELAAGVEKKVKIGWGDITKVVLGKGENTDSIFVQNNVVREVEIKRRTIEGDFSELFKDIQNAKDNFKDN